MTSEDERGGVIHLAHDLTGATVLVFGGGRVGARRARALDEARVLVVSPDFVESDYGRATLVRAEPGPEYARELIERAEPALVVAATDDAEINAAVAAAGRDVGALVNRADRAADAAGDVDVPASVTDGSVVASVSTGGRSPTVSAHLRDRIAEAVDGSGVVAEVAGELRAELRDRELSTDRRRTALRAIAERDAVWEAAKDGGDVRAIATEIVADVLGESEDGGDR